jgi:hypothetical protein
MKHLLGDKNDVIICYLVVITVACFVFAQSSAQTKGADVLVNKYQGAGSYEIAFNGDKLSSGVCIYRFVSSKYRETNKMLLIK